MARRLLLSALLCLFGTGYALAQEVTGTVTDAASGFPLPGVNIQIQGTQTGTITAFDGSYSIQADQGDVLVFSYVGYLPQEVAVEGTDPINVALDEDVEALEEVVVVGYGVQRKVDVTAAVSSVNVRDANVGVVTSPDQLIQGRVAGVQVIQNNGEPGSSVTVRIRGGTSISASNEPLYVIDGVPLDNSSTTPGGSALEVASGPRNPLNMLNPNDIESIDILKDASAAAIYGSRGANGVILITTKSGRAGQVTVDYDTYIASSSLTRKQDLLTGDQYRQEAGRLGLDTSILGSANTDWQEEVTRQAVSQSHNLAFAGGTNATQYRASLSYLDDQGLILNSGLERVTGRANIRHQAIDGRLRFDVNLTSAFIEDNHTPYQQTGGFTGGLFTNVFKFNPTFPVRNPDGTFFELPNPGIRNPVAMAEQIEDFTKTTRTLGNLVAAFDIIEGLEARMNVGVNRSQSSRRTFVPRASPIAQAAGGRAEQKNRELSSTLIETTLRYGRSLQAGHTVNVLGGYSFQDFLFEEFGAFAQDFVTDAWSFNNLSGGANFAERPFSQRQSSKLVSFFGRVDYDFLGKYLATVSLRRDGSSRFGDNNKWAVFPAVSLGWRLSDDLFANSTTISDLKLRVGYGIVGSQEIGNYRSLATLAPAVDPNNPQEFIGVIGNEQVTGVAPNNLATPDLKWEETTTINVGLDYSLWAGRIQGALEYYIKDTDDLLLEIQVPAPAVVQTRLDNVGSIQNTGIEFSVDGFIIDRRDFTFVLGANFNANQNEIKDLGGRESIFTGRVSGAGQSGVNAQVLLEGEAYGTFIGPVWEGFDGEGNNLFRTADGGTTTSLSDAERVIIGNAQPDFSYGINGRINYKNIDFSFFARGEQGRDVFNNTALEYSVLNNFNTNINLYEDALSDGSGLSATPVYSSRWIQDASFLRLENVTVGYTFNVPQLRLRTARVYVTGQNLFVITGYDGYDPEVNTDAGTGAQGYQALSVPSLGIDYTNYPRPRRFLAGISLGF
ncbi:MAG: TonB-dependent receptor [Bacteroidota bacterium]